MKSSEQPPQRSLRVTPDINLLFHKKPLEVTENELNVVLRKYNLRDALQRLGKISAEIFSRKDKDLGSLGYIDAETRVMVTQYAAAYLANIFICSGANDSNKMGVDVSDNVLGLFGLYQDRLIDAVDLSEEDKVKAFFIRLAFQQLIFQKSSVNTIARAVVLFRDIAPNIKASGIESFDKVFQEQNGLGLKTYFELCLIIYAAAVSGNSTFGKGMFTNAKLPKVQGVLTEESIENMLCILSCDYETFRKEDGKANQNLDPVLTKNKFNPLFVYPIIKTQVAPDGNAYVVPNISAFLDKAYLGIFWWFHRYYEGRDEQKDFRTYFGGVFQEYVGKILQATFGAKNVQAEFPYSKENIMFVDWFVECENKAYLFEAKASQFALKSKLTGSVKTIKENELKKMVKPIVQLFKKVRDIDKYAELKRFRGKKIYPITVVMDLPFIEGPVYKEWIQQELNEIEQKNPGLRGLKEFEAYFLNIEDLELYSGVQQKPELEDILLKVKNDHHANFRSKCFELASHNGARCQFLDDVYRGLWRAIIGNPPDFVMKKDLSEKI